MDMLSKKAKKEEGWPRAAMDLFSKDGESEYRRMGRRLVLEFMNSDAPFLHRVEFKGNGQNSNFEYLQLGNLEEPKHGFRKDKMAKVLPYFFLENICAKLNPSPARFVLQGGTGTPAATLGYALADSNGSWRMLFTEYLPKGGSANRVNKIFGGDNFHGKSGSERVVYLNEAELPLDCIEIILNRNPVVGVDALRELAANFRKANELPEPKFQPAAPEVEEAKEPPRPPAPVPPIQNLENKVGPDENSDASKPKRDPHNAPRSESKIDWRIDGGIIETKSKSKSKRKFDRPVVANTKIDPQLFEIQNPEELEWADSSPLINFGVDGSEADIWRIRDASEGLLILGAVGSGKTSSSGSNLAIQFLKAGYGCLVLTAKQDEARRWFRLCEWTGRSQDCVHFTLNSGHKLNILEYESQRPSEGVAMTDNMIGLFRCLLEVMSTDFRGTEGDRFWHQTGDQLMRWLFEVFILAQEPLSMDGFVRFLRQAPTEPGQDWEGIEYFSDLILRAEENAATGSDTDQRVFYSAFDYWTTAFPKITEVTRSGIVTSFSAMASTLNARDIHEILCGETNLTPEMILSGKIVIADFPTKIGFKGGLMIQAALKLLFQQAIERRKDKGLSTARPCVLWEDEGHTFFSSHDVVFQPTARDCRACHVILSQNLRNFLHLGHSEHAVNAVFSAMNTNIYHANVDALTNDWASRKIGDEEMATLTPQNIVRPFNAAELSIFQTPPPHSSSLAGSFSIREETKRAVPPEEFTRLKRGGDGTSEAIIHWLSHRFAANKNRSYIKRIFLQEPR